MPPTRATFPPTITASQWDTAWQACFSAALKSHGRAHASDGTLVPPLTNGEAVQLVMAWHRHEGDDHFPLWGQFGAAAYGWTADNGQMDISASQRDRLYPLQLSKELWLALQQVAYRLQRDTATAAADQVRLDLTATFDDVTVQGAIANELRADGADVTFRKEGRMAPTAKPKPKKPTTPAWVTLAWLYFGYRVLKNLTGGTRYQG